MDVALTSPVVATRQEWLEKRMALLARERELTRLREALARERRALPWVRLEKAYVFDTPAGPRGLADLFEGRSQLAVYHFMLPPGLDHICPGCSFLCDHVDGARQHFEQADLSFAAVSRAPLNEIEAVRKRMGWTFAFVSSAGTSFNADFGVYCTKEEVEAGTAQYNFGTTPPWPGDMHGVSIFAKDGAGTVYHTYSAYGRSGEDLVGAFSWLDLAPKGRNEGDGVMSWVRLHDEYPRAGLAPAACCG